MSDFNELLNAHPELGLPSDDQVLPGIASHDTVQSLYDLILSRVGVLDPGQSFRCRKFTNPDYPHLALDALVKRKGSIGEPDSVASLGTKENTVGGLVLRRYSVLDMPDGLELSQRIVTRPTQSMAPDISGVQQILADRGAAARLLRRVEPEELLAEQATRAKEALAGLNSTPEAVAVYARELLRGAQAVR